MNHCEHKVDYYYYYLAAGDERRADGLVPSHSHLTNTVLTDCFFAIVIINGCKFLSLFRNGCVSSAPALPESFNTRMFGETNPASCAARHPWKPWKTLICNSRIPLCNSRDMRSASPLPPLCVFIMITPSSTISGRCIKPALQLHITRHVGSLADSRSVLFHQEAPQPTAQTGSLKLQSLFLCFRPSHAGISPVDDDAQRLCELCSIGKNISRLCLACGSSVLLAGGGWRAFCPLPLSIR